uniref:Uncharacterized protein n=1 Tax=Anguilla anguilla TaxID=7936 RepID=A0A0E9S5Y2_ANGAN
MPSSCNKYRDQEGASHKNKRQKQEYQECCVQQLGHTGTLKDAKCQQRKQVQPASPNIGMLE